MYRNWRWPWDPKIPNKGGIPVHRSLRPTYSGYMPELVGWGIIGLFAVALIAGVIILVYIFS